jgi:glycosyltransferase involved in cell wall biosynthesis
MLWRLRKAKVKIVFTPHYHGGGHTGLANFAHIFYRKLSSLVIGRADSVIAVSDGESELIKEHFPQLKDKIAVIPNGVVQPAKQKPFEKENPVLLTVSRLEPYKRIDKIIEELPEGLQLVIVGAGKDYDRLQQLATDLRKDVVLTGGISDDELNRWWNTADTFISLSEKEAYGLTFGEAMSMGLPCIVSDIPSYHFVYDLFEKPSGVVFYREKQDFMRQYTSAVADKTSKSKATVFTWDKAAEELSQIYKEMI